MEWSSHRGPQRSAMAPLPFHCGGASAVIPLPTSPCILAVPSTPPPRCPSPRPPGTMVPPCLTCCFAVPLRRGPNVALSSPQSVVIECFLARLDRPTNLHPPLGRLGRHPRITKSDGSMAGQPGPALEPMFCGVCVQCISGLLLGRHQYNRFPNRPLPFPNLPPRGVELSVGSYLEPKPGGRASPPQGGARRRTAHCPLQCGFAHQICHCPMPQALGRCLTAVPLPTTLCNAVVPSRRT